MDKCACGNDAITISVDADPHPLCEEHFIPYFEKKVEDTIARYHMLTKEQDIAVACSGGKDSMTILLLLHHWGYKVTGLLIDEGIKGYRDKTIEEFDAICQEQGIKTKKLSYAHDIGKSLDTMLADDPKRRSCTVCGIFRRHLLQKGAEGFDVLVTGHNLDDEAQAIMMNLLKGQVELLARLGPVHASSKGFVPRVKPLYFCSEREVRIYTLVKSIPIQYRTCPHAPGAFRDEFSHGLNRLEDDCPGSKWHLVHSFLEMDLAHGEEMRICTLCGNPSAGAVCKACMLKKEVLA